MFLTVKIRELRGIDKRFTALNGLADGSRSVRLRRKIDQFGAQIGAFDTRIGAFDTRIGALVAQGGIQKSRKNQGEMKVPKMIYKAYIKRI